MNSNSNRFHVDAAKAILNDNREETRQNIESFLAQEQGCAETHLVHAWTANTLADAEMALNNALELDAEHPTAMVGLAWIQGIREIANEQLERQAEAERMEQERLEAERMEQERLEAERLEAERLEAERIEQERLEAERMEQERLEAERLEAERLEAERMEQERLEAERMDQERLEAERLEAERLEAERMEQERLKAERLEQEQLEQERLEAERLEAERLEQERLEQEQLEAERLEVESIQMPEPVDEQDDFIFYELEDGPQAAWDIAESLGQTDQLSPETEVASDMVNVESIPATDTESEIQQAAESLVDEVRTELESAANVVSEVQEDETAATEMTIGDRERQVILAVDDSPTIRKLVSLTLEEHGYEVLTAADGIEALNILAERLPHLILSDINMPRMNGYKLCKFVKKHERTSAVPVVMLSGKEGMFDKMRGKMNGCNDFITKPFEAADLVAKVREHVSAPVVS